MEKGFPIMMIHHSKRVVNTYTYLDRLLITKLKVAIFWSRYSASHLVL
jgi:hypothetical protein